jgi:DNA-binding NtrC family response regulator
MATMPPLHEALSDFKRKLVMEALALCHGNRSRAAMALGIERTSLLRLIRELAIGDVPPGRRGRPPISNEPVSRE